VDLKVDLNAIKEIEVIKRLKKQIESIIEDILACAF
jgi:hypothetical protein